MASSKGKKIDLEEPREYWGTKYFAGDKPGAKARTERQWWLGQLDGAVPAGWASKAFKMWFSPRAAANALKDEGPAVEAFNQWRASEEGKGNDGK